MAINENFTLPEKELGLYGDLTYTWNFDIHWPEITIDHLDNLTGTHLPTKAGSTEKANAQIKLVSRLSKVILFQKLLRSTHYDLEYIVAHDTERIAEILEYQAHIFQAGFVDGGWISMYETTDAHGMKSQIGLAAETFLEVSNLSIQQYRLYIDPALYRVGY